MNISSKKFAIAEILLKQKNKYYTAKTVADRLSDFKGIAPGFNFLRHALAFTIMAHHARVAVFGTGATDGYAKAAAFTAKTTTTLTTGQLLVELLRPGLFALVGMFFALSGFLVVASAIRTKSTGKFFRNRVMRILPALSVEVALSALVLGPLVTTLPLGEYFRGEEFLLYFWNIVGHIHYELPGVFTHNPWPRMVNASLWTLPAEFYCYLIMLVFLLLGLKTSQKLFTATAITTFVIIFAGYLVNHSLFEVRADTSHYTSWYIVAMFCIGAMIYLHADRIPFGLPYFVASLAIYYLLMIFDAIGPLSGIFLAYCTVYIGLTSFKWFDRLVQVDVSYGMYLYSFPITQGVIHFIEPHLQHYGNAIEFGIIFPVILIITITFAYASWELIEAPFLNLRHRFDNAKVR